MKKVIKPKKVVKKAVKKIEVVSSETIVREDGEDVIRIKFSDGSVRDSII